ncbi:MAG: 2OG-Fe(II) oxygenase family protein [Sphingomicrobium sp.]
MAPSAAMLRDQAIAAAARGDAARAGALFDQAVEAAPRDVSILNSAAAHWSKAGNPARAIELFERAVAADLNAGEPAINLAILLTNAGRSREAVELLEPRATALASNPRYWSVRANAERTLGLKRNALASYERAWALNRSNARAAEGRARLALETGIDARSLYRDALSLAATEPTLILGYGQALEAAGDLVEARSIGDRPVRELPGWIPALEWLAELRWAGGEQDEFTDHYAKAASRAPAPELFDSWCKMLAGVDQFGKAADVAANARMELGDRAELALREAIHAGEAGEDARAEAIFAVLPISGAVRDVQEARHRLRTRDPERAEQLTARAIASDPDNIAAWALRDIAWRLLGDPRHDWLHGQEGLVRPMHLDLDAQRFASIVTLLDRLHDKSSMPVGQSVRQGSQTRGGLFDRHEPEIEVLEASFREAVQGYRDQLPPRDHAHPLLRHRDESWRFAGSWSIRVFEGGRHTEHIHPQGIVSSAAYFVVPQIVTDGDEQAGWLELGRPPPDLKLDLPPLYAFEPLPGRCALFPSTLYHGTRRFSGGKRMTVAIDIHLGSE